MRRPGIAEEAAAMASLRLHGAFTPAVLVPSSAGLILRMIYMRDTFREVAVSVRRVLVVDDEPHIRVVLRGSLEADGFDVSKAPTGKLPCGGSARTRLTWCCRT
jgi:hypothetical protein